MRREGGVAVSHLMNTAVHRSPNKLWRSNSIFNLWLAALLKTAVNVSWDKRYSNPSHIHQYCIVTYARALIKPQKCITPPIYLFTKGEGVSSYYLIYSMLQCITKELTFTVCKQLYIPRTSSVWLRWAGLSFKLSVQDRGPLSDLDVQKNIV